MFGVAELARRTTSGATPKPQADHVVESVSFLRVSKSLYVFNDGPISI